MAGALLMPLAQRHGASIVPVDSEHSAIHQCLRGERLESVRRVILTASGGPFRQHSQAELERATPAAALQHPNWTMGPRITIGSATLMNKALEVIELAHLFGLDAGRIDVAIHPQSIVHSLVEFIDGSVVAQLGLPDMRVPIHYAIHHPERAPSQLPGFDWQRFAKLEFQSPDSVRFPALRMGFEALERGGSAGAVLNAADEVAVEAFLAGRIGFLEMAQVQQAALSTLDLPAETIEDILRADQVARDFAADLICRLEQST
jgi:1-deoxy-D-xylulose-5-phosphate reductoisomerase